MFAFIRMRFSAKNSHWKFVFFLNFRSYLRNIFNQRDGQLNVGAEKKEIQPFECVGSSGHNQTNSNEHCIGHEKTSSKFRNRLVTSLKNISVRKSYPKSLKPTRAQLCFFRSNRCAFSAVIIRFTGRSGGKERSEGVRAETKTSESTNERNS